MKRKKYLLLGLGLVILSLSLMTCKPIGYYLEKVYKVYGTVTVDKTNPPVPLRSVEVFLDDYQYSELTNYDGLYELEIAEGTWTISFVKDGYETFSDEVTVGPDNPRERLDPAMKPLTPPLPSDPFIGQWHGTFPAGPGLTVTALFEFFKNGTFSETILEFPATFSGDYEKDEIAQTFTVTVTATSDPVNVPIGFTQTPTYSFSSDNNTMTFSVGGGSGTVTRGPTINGVFSTWWCPEIIPEGMQMTSAVMALYEGGSFEILYMVGGVPIKQTGTFLPVTAPLGAPIEFTVDFSSGPPPGAPPVGTKYLVKLSALAASTMDFEIDLANNGFDGPYHMQRQ